MGAYDDPRSIIAQVAKANGIGDYTWIPTAIAYGESGFDPNRVGDNGKSVGLFQYHENGRGAGWGDKRKDPWAITQDVMPAMAATIKQGIAAGLQGLDLLKYVWYEVERPQRSPQADANMANAYQTIIGGENMPDTPYVPSTYGAAGPTLSGVPTPPNNMPTLPEGYKLIPIPDASGNVIQYILEYPDTMDLPDGTKVTITRRQTVSVPSEPKGPTDTPVDWANVKIGEQNAKTSAANAATSAQNAKSSRIQALADWVDQMMAVAGWPKEQALKVFNAEVQRIQLEQDNAYRQGTLDQTASRQNLDRAQYANDDSYKRAQAEGERKRDIQNTATTRATSVAQNILPFSVPGATSMTLPLLGNMPLTQVNPDQLYSQGLPSLVDQYNTGTIPQGTQMPWPDAVTAPQMPAVDYSRLPQIPQAEPIDVNKILQAVLPYINY